MHAVGGTMGALLTGLTIGLRPTHEDEEIGLDLTDHGERGYHTGELGGGHIERDEHAEHAAAE